MLRGLPKTVGVVSLVLSRVWFLVWLLLCGFGLWMSFLDSGAYAYADVAALQFIGAKLIAVYVVVEIIPGTKTIQQ